MDLRCDLDGGYDVRDGCPHLVLRVGLRSLWQRRAHAESEFDLQGETYTPLSFGFEHEKYLSGKKSASQITPVQNRHLSINSSFVHKI